MDRIKKLEMVVEKAAQECDHRVEEAGDGNPSFGLDEANRAYLDALEDLEDAHREGETHITLPGTDPEPEPALLLAPEPGPFRFRGSSQPCSERAAHAPHPVRVLGLDGYPTIDGWQTYFCPGREGPVQGGVLRIVVTRKAVGNPYDPARLEGWVEVHDGR